MKKLLSFFLLILLCFPLTGQKSVNKLIDKMKKHDQAFALTLPGWLIRTGMNFAVDDKVKLWMGDSVAHWDGDTLVIETKNFNNRGMIANSSAGGRLKGVPAGENLHVIERFTRVSDSTIMWEARVTDPDSFSSPFTISMPLTKDDEYVMYEYACHEGNYAIPNILSAGRARERQQASN